MVASAPLRLPPRQQYTSGFQPRGLSITSRSMWAAMLRAEMAAPRFLASNALTCLYIVPIVMRSALSSVGQLMAPRQVIQRVLVFGAGVDHGIEIVQSRQGGGGGQGVNRHAGLSRAA